MKGCVFLNNIDIMNYWIDSANNDYETINVLFAGRKYTWSLFVGHLVIEKLIKALHAKMNKSTPHAHKSHDLSYLASKIPLELTDEQKILLNTITRFNLDGRYDDYKNNFYPWIKPNSKCHSLKGMLKLHYEILDFYDFIKLTNNEIKSRNRNSYKNPHSVPERTPFKRKSSNRFLASYVMLIVYL